jgi:hypothetical protein
MMDIESAKAAVAAFEELLDKTDAESAHARVRPGAWTLAEITGHLIDSASNNHQRFARLRLGGLEGFPGYDAEPWVAAQGYNSCDFLTLATLWSSYNAFLLHLAETTPEAALENAWTTLAGPKTLGFLIEDYYAHLRMHVEHYAERLTEVRAALAGS